MRDIIVTMIVFASLPAILWRPWIGIIMWTWLGFMNPHRLAWGFSTTMPFAMIVALTTLVALLFSREPKRIPWTRETVVLALFILWMTFTTFFAMYPVLAWPQLEKVLKIQLMIFVAMILINTRERLHALVWTIALSLGFYGVKGGIFTIMTGGAYRVQGPPGTFIGANNELGLALGMTIPLIYYLYRQTDRSLVRLGLGGAMVLTAIAAIGTQSRGALLGMAAMGVMLWLKSKQKFLIALAAGVSVYAIVQIMPEAWYTRMNTIQTYEQEGSAQGRLEAWRMALNLVRDRPLGGGFEAFQPASFVIYNPSYENAHDAHSIYFEVLGEHGYVGLALFLVLGLMTWLSASSVRREAEARPQTVWLADLNRMVQVALVAYATAGAFLGMAYFDLYYNLVLIVVSSRVILAKETTALKKLAASDSAPQRSLAGTPAPRSLPRGQRALP